MVAYQDSPFYEACIFSEVMRRSVGRAGQDLRYSVSLP